MMYFNARYYDPELGRFAQADPTVPDFTNSQAFNRYMFCYGNPITYADVNGFEATTSPCYNGAVESVNGHTVPSPGTMGAPTITAPNGATNVSESKGNSSGTQSGAPSTNSGDGNGPSGDGQDGGTPSGGMREGHSDSAPASVYFNNASPYNFDFGRDYSAVAVQLWNDKHYAASMYAGLVSDAELIDDMFLCYLGAAAVGLAVEVVAAAPEVTTTIASKFASKPVTQSISRASSRTLGMNLKAAGFSRPASTAAHHIVAGTAKNAASARAVLQRFNIDINAAENGVFLPASSGVSSSLSSVHSTLHTNAYYDKVNQMLSQASSRAEAIEILGIIRDNLKGGTF